MIPAPPTSTKQHLSANEKRKQYRAKLPIKQSGKVSIHGVSCTMLARACLYHLSEVGGRPTPGSRECLTGSMQVRLKAHGESQTLRDAVLTAGMAQQAENGNSVLELHCSAAAKEAARKAERNRWIILKQLRSIYFLEKTKTRLLTPLFIQI